jgi:hypothetical protein
MFEIERVEGAGCEVWMREKRWMVQCTGRDGSVDERGTDVELD